MMRQAGSGVPAFVSYRESIQRVKLSSKRIVMGSPATPRRNPRGPPGSSVSPTYPRRNPAVPSDGVPAGTLYDISRYGLALCITMTFPPGKERLSKGATASSQRDSGLG